MQRLAAVQAPAVEDAAPAVEDAAPVVEDAANEAAEKEAANKLAEQAAENAAGITYSLRIPTSRTL